MIWRLVAPPSFPRIIGPRSAHWTEHVAAQDPRADVFKRLQREIVVDPALTAAVPGHFVKDVRGKEPGVKLSAADAKGILQILPGPGAVSIEGNRKCSNFEFRHGGFWMLPVERWTHSRTEQVD